MDRQDIFNRTWQTFVVEGAPWAGDPETGDCYYRGPNGSKCIIGALIPDEKYVPELEDNGPRSLKVARVLLEIGLIDELPETYHKETVGGDGVSFLSQLQRVHDRYHVEVSASNPADFTEFMREGLTWFAHEHGLTVPQEDA